VQRIIPFADLEVRRTKNNIFRILKMSYSSQLDLRKIQVFKIKTILKKIRKKEK
jgi:Leucine-rich repeat (LRR) protein